MTTPERPARLVPWHLRREDPARTDVRALAKKCYQNKRTKNAFISCTLTRARAIIPSMEAIPTLPLERAKPDLMLGGGGLALRMKTREWMYGGGALRVSPRGAVTPPAWWFDGPAKGLAHD